MSRDDPIFRLRLPDPLKDRLKELAETSRRSLTQEIVDRLEKSLVASDSAGVPDFSQPDRIESLEQEIENLRAIVRGVEARLNTLEVEK
ncbi:Arc family DNA-binding protein [Pseudogemmobacter sonorensis]|uniref:Arc family DNA-binding protein n=1 Tax=Pseudogemmobacter sonorensis TaxID=2989681 RepID=UPI0036C311E3